MYLNIEAYFNIVYFLTLTFNTFNNINILFQILKRENMKLVPCESQSEDCL